MMGSGSDVTFEMNANISAVSDSNNNYKPDKSLLEKTALNKRISEPSVVKETKPGRNPETKLNPGETERIKVSSLSEKNIKCRTKVIREEIIGFGKQKRKVGVDQKHLTTKEGHSSLLLTEKFRAAEYIRRRIVFKGSSGPKNSRYSQQSSVGRSQDLERIKRKVPDNDGVVPEKKLRTVNPELLIENQICDENSLTTAVNKNKECVDSPTACKDAELGQLAKGLNVFVKKEALTNVSANEGPPQEQGESLSTVTQGTSSTNDRTTSNSGRLLSAGLADNQEFTKKSMTFNHLFGGRCLTYLKTSRCNRPCRLSHNPYVSVALVVKMFGDDNIQSLLNVLQKFVSEAPHPPLQLIENACNIFATHQRLSGILSVSNIFTRRRAYGHNAYMRNILKIMIRALHGYYRNDESSVFFIVKYFCTIVAQKDSRQEIIDKMVTMIQETMKLDNNWEVYSSLVTIEDYVWPERLLIDLLEEFLYKKNLSNEKHAFIKFTDLLLKDSHNKHLFSIWKCFPKWLNQLSYYYFEFGEYSKAKALKEKLTSFYSSVYTKPCYMPLDQYQNTREIWLSNSGIREVQNMEKHPGTSFPPFTEIGIIRNLNNNSNTGVIRRQKIPSSDLLLVNFDDDMNSLQNFMDVNDYYHILTILYKWQHSQYISNLRKHLFILLREIRKNKGCAVYYITSHGFLSALINIPNLSQDMKKSLASLSVTLLLDMVMAELWEYAYEILEIVLKYEFICFSCEVYVAEDYSPAKRNIVFSTVCFRNGDLEKAVKLLIKQNMLAIDRQQWYLVSSDRDMATRNELIKLLMDKSIKFNHLFLSYRFLMHLVEAQENIMKPINLVSAYESLLRTFLEQTDYLCVALQLFKQIYSYHKKPIVFDKILCRLLVVTCFNENEIALSKHVFKMGHLIGVYKRNASMFEIEVNSIWTRPEMMLVIDKALNKILKHTKRSTALTFSTIMVDSDLTFKVVEGDSMNTDLPNVLMGIDSSLHGAIWRLKSVLRTEYSPPLHITDGQESGPPYVVIEKSVLVNYFSQVESTQTM